MTSTRKNPDVYVADSDIHGKGLFAARRIFADELIGVYEGPRVDENGTYVLWVQEDDSGDWTGYDGRNEMRFMNHSDEPNAEMDGLECFALREIQRGEEITIDYGWNDRDE